MVCTGVKREQGTKNWQEYKSTPTIIDNHNRDLDSNYN